MIKEFAAIAMKGDTLTKAKIRESARAHCERWVVGVINNEELEILLPSIIGWVDCAQSPSKKIFWSEVALWINEFFGLKGDQRISKIKCHKVARWVMDQYEKHGRMTAISDEELEAKTQELMPDYYAKYKS